MRVAFDTIAASPAALFPRNVASRLSRLAPSARRLALLEASDGKIGTVDQFFFDDETWAIRYLTVGTDGWLGDRQVLISPFSIVHTDWQARRLDVSLTKKQVENSPNIDTRGWRS